MKGFIKLKPYTTSEEDKLLRIDFVSIGQIAEIRGTNFVGDVDIAKPPPEMESPEVHRVEIRKIGQKHFDTYFTPLLAVENQMRDNGTDPDGVHE